MPELHLDCPAGIAGDMFLAALADLGVVFAPLQAAFESAGVDVVIEALDATDHGLAGKRMHIQGQAEQPLRYLPDLLGIIHRLPVSKFVRAASARAFSRLAEVEARVHGYQVEDVHFHEIGAVDTLVDVVGAFWALEALGIQRVTCSHLPWFSGTVACAHGCLPLPAPATLELLQGKPVYPSAFRQEIITPTGALLADQVVDAFTAGPAGRLGASGLGLGNLELDMVNGLRAYLVRGHDPGFERVVVLETNIDHLTGEEMGAALGAILDSGALDVIFLPGVMKKNRPGGLLQVLCRPKDAVRVRETVFAQTMTLGIRITETRRAVLPRQASTRPSIFGELAVKEMVVEGSQYSRPEFEALKKMAKRTGRSVAQLRYLLGDAQKEE